LLLWSIASPKHSRRAARSRRGACACRTVFEVSNDVFTSREPKHICASDPVYPLFVGIINNSSKTLDKVTFSLKATRKGYSTDLATYASYTDDRIRKPGEGWGGCWHAPLQTDVKDDPRDLEWKVESVSMIFE